MSLSQSDRSTQNRINALRGWSKRDGREGTANARRAGPGAVEYWEAKLDPDGLLSPNERRRRAESAKRAHFLELSLKAAQARRHRDPGQ